MHAAIAAEQAFGLVSAAQLVQIDVRARIHHGLAIDAQLELGAECGVVFGDSGVGKTTLLRLVAGLRRPDSGSVRLMNESLFDGERGIDLPLRRRRIGWIAQDDLLFPHLDVAGNVAFGLQGWSAREKASRVGEVARLCGLTRLLDRSPETLSGGERQRVGLARAIAPRPRLLICDEPISALDLDSRFDLIARLRHLNRTEAVPLLFVTHSPAEAIAVGDRLFLMRSGRIVDVGLPLDVLAAAGSGLSFEELSNVFEARKVAFDSPDNESTVELDGGPRLVVPTIPAEFGERVSVAIRAHDILLANSMITGLSARNVLRGTIERIVRRSTEAEVVVLTGASRWIVSVVASAVGELQLQPGREVHMIIKARSCHVQAIP